MPDADARAGSGDAVAQAASELGRVHLHAAGAEGVAAAADGPHVAPPAAPAAVVSSPAADDDDGGGDAADIIDDDGEAEAPRKKRVVTGTAEGDPREHLNMITIGHVDAGASFGRGSNDQKGRGMRRPRGAWPLGA